MRAHRTTARTAPGLKWRKKWNAKQGDEELVARNGRYAVWQAPNKPDCWGLKVEAPPPWQGMYGPFPNAAAAQARAEQLETGNARLTTTTPGRSLLDCPGDYFVRRHYDLTDDLHQPLRPQLIAPPPFLQIGVQIVNSM